MHDSVIHSLDELAAYTKEHGKEAKWRDELGYQRKRIGDFACYVSLIYGVFARWNMMRVSKGMRKIKEFDIVLKSDILITY